jgi:hypothetical protein
MKGRSLNEFISGSLSSSLIACTTELGAGGDEGVKRDPPPGQLVLKICFQTSTDSICVCFFHGSNYT